MSTDPACTRVALGSCAVEIETRTPKLTQALSFLLKDIDSEGGELQTRFILDFDENENRFTTTRNDKICYRTDTAGKLCTHLVGEIIYHLIDNNSTELLLHAACVARNNVGILLPGVSGSGKSTLCAWLLTRGFEYLSDELVSLDPGTLDARSFSRPLNIKFDGMRAIRKQLVNNIEEHCVLDGNISHLVEHRVFNHSFRSRSIHIGAIIFPRYVTSADFNLEHLTNAKTALLLMQAFVNARNHSQHGFHDIARFARSAKGFQLTYSDFEQLPKLEQALLEITDKETVF